MLPITGITTSLVSSTIGLSSNDVGTLCKSSKVNKWSKYKPVNYSSNGSIYGTSGNDTTILKSVNYGFSIPTYTDIDSAINSSSVWTYTTPTVCRIGDFRNYEQSATVPYSLLVPNYVLANSTGNVVKLMLDTTANLQLTDIFRLCFFGVIIKKDTQVICKTLSTNIESGGTTLDFSGCGLLSTSGTLTIMAFITDIAITSWSSTVSQNIWSLDHISGYAKKSCSVYVQQSDEYIIGLDGDMTIMDKKCITFTGTISVSDRITRTATINSNAPFSTDYFLPISNAITVSVMRNSDGVIVYTNTYNSDYMTSPTSLTIDMMNGEGCNFNIPSGSIPTLPQLGVNDHYVYMWALNFTT